MVIPDEGRRLAEPKEQVFVPYYWQRTCVDMFAPFYNINYLAKNEEWLKFCHDTNMVRAWWSVNLDVANTIRWVFFLPTLDFWAKSMNFKSFIVN